MLPAIEQDQDLILCSVHTGRAVSSVVIGGQDRVTEVIDVVIEPGASKLYLVLISHQSMIWRLSGDVARVVHVVLSASDDGPDGIRLIPPPSRPPGICVRVPSRPTRFPQPSASGVIGVPRSRVTIADGDSLPSFSKWTDKKAASTVERLVAITGRKPARVFPEYSVRTIALPSGNVVPLDPQSVERPDGFDQRCWQDAIRSWPGGLVRIDPADVVSAFPVSEYVVLPSQMGLAQLVGAGAIEPVGRALRIDVPRAVKGDVAAVESVPGGFRLTRPIARFPPGMGGAHSVTFRLPDGVPLPLGDNVHSKVVSDETGEIMLDISVKLRRPH